MQILLDEQSCDIDASSIGDAIARAAAIAEGQQRMIVEVVVDGTAWREPQLSSAELCAGDAKEVRLVSADPKALVDRTLLDASAALAEGDALQRTAAEQIQAGRIPEAMDQLGEALAIWAAVQEAVVKCGQVLDLDFDAITLGSGTVRERMERLQPHLEALRAALVSKDPVGVSDTLLYELPEAVADWRELLDEIRIHLQGERS